MIYLIVPTIKIVKQRIIKVKLNKIAENIIFHYRN